MTVSITTRAGKGAALTHNELDANFTAIKSAVDDLQAASPLGVVEVHHGGTGLSAVVGAYAAIRGNSGGTAYEGATIEGTTNQVTVSTGTAGKWVLGTPQNLHTAATPTFGGLTVGSATGIVKWTSGVLGSASSGTDYVAGGTGSANQMAYFTGAGAIAGSSTATFDPAGNFSTSRPFRVTDTTASTNTSSGALVVSGGAGISGDVRASGVFRARDSSSVTNPSGLTYGFISGFTTTHSSNTSAQVFGLYGSTRPLVNNSITASGIHAGVYSECVRNFSVSEGNGTTTSVYGSLFIFGHYAANATATPNTTNVIGIALSPYIQSGSIATMKGIFLEAPFSGGTVTNYYGIYLADVSVGSNNYAIYTNAGAVRFGGAVTVADTTASTSTTTGALVVSGGVGIAGQINCVLATVTGTAATDLPTYGSEFLSGTGWTSTDWTGDWAGGWTHTAGNTSVLSQSTAAVSATKYQIAYTITGRTAGSVTIAFGGQSQAGITATGAWGPTTTSTANLTVTPTSDFNGAIVLSIKAITAASSATQTWKSSSGTARNELRANSGNSNLYLGLSAGEYNTTGFQNVGIGSSALQYTTTGFGNTGVGSSACRYTTTGYANMGFGTQALLYNTTGSENIAIGNTALQTCTAGYGNVAIGVEVMFNLTTGYYNVAIGGISGSGITEGSRNTLVGYWTGVGITTGTGNTVIGAGITGLAAATTNNIILASGNTNRMSFDGTDWSVASTTEATTHTAASVKIAGGLAVAKRIATPKLFVTEEGGIGIRMTAGENLVRGEVVSSIQGAGGADGKVWKTPSSGNENEMPLGVVFASASADAEVVVVVSGIAYVLPEAGITAARGNVLLTSTSTAGRVTQSATGGSSAAHWRECGHWIDTGSGNGAITRAVLHFN